MQKIAVTRKISVNMDGGWPVDVDVVIYPTHYDLNDPVWVVYARDLVDKYQFYVGKVTISAIRQERHNALKPGTYNIWRTLYYYQVVGAKGQNVLGDYENIWVSAEQLFKTKAEAITHMRSALLVTLDEDRKRHSKYLSITEATMQQVKDSAIELQYAGVE